MSLILPHTRGLYVPNVAARGAAAAAWATSWSATMTGDQGSRAGYTIRNIYGAADLTQSASAGKTRITMINTAGALSIDACYIGHQGAGDAYDFDSTPVQIKVGGAGSFSIGTTDTLSDEAVFSLDETKAVVIAFAINAGASGNNRYLTPSGGLAAYEKSGASDAATVDATGYSAAANGLVFVNKIEVYQ